MGVKRPGWAPSSMMCSFDVTWPAFEVFVANEMSTESLSFPAICLNQTPVMTRNMAAESIQDLWQGASLTRNEANDAAWASRA